VYDLHISAEPVQELAFLAEQSGQWESLEPGHPKMPRSQPWEVLQLQGNRENQKEQKVVERREITDQVAQKVAAVYEWLDMQLQGAAEQAPSCDSCGKCCDFETFDHRLFVTPPELTYLAARLDGEKVKAMPTGRCPYNIIVACSIYDYRFAGCRIFCCKGNKDFQSALSESVLEKLKAICTEFGIPYRYLDLAAALNGYAES